MLPGTRVFFEGNYGPNTSCEQHYAGVPEGNYFDREIHEQKMKGGKVMYHLQTDGGMRRL